MYELYPDLIQTRISVPRNKELMRVFKDLELVEQLGSGIPRILEHYGKESFNFSENFLRMTFMAKETDANKNDEKDDADVSEVGGQIGGQIGGVIGGEIGGAIEESTILTKRQKEVLKLIVANNAITYNEIAEELGINESAVGKHINAIKDKGFLERKEGTRGYWQVNVIK